MQRDEFFEEEHEAALDERALFLTYGKNWNRLSVSYFGFIGFFLILQSMVLRTPKALKRILFRPLTYLDMLCMGTFPPSWNAAFIVCWKRADSDSAGSNIGN